MLIQFSVQNYKSIDKKITLSMVKGRTRDHKEHLIDSPEYKMSILKGAIIYGANASGKSNLIKAINKAKNIIIKNFAPYEKIDIPIFKLSKTKRPTVFEFDILLNKVIYNYGFEINNGIIKKEWLKRYLKTGGQKLIFERKTINNKAKVEINYNSLVKKKDKKIFDFIADGTRSNVLFLSETINRNRDEFRNIYDWFKDSLIIVFPTSKIMDLPGVLTFADTKEITSIISKVDFGINEVVIEKKEISKMTESPISADIINDFKNNKNNRLIVTDMFTGNKIILSKSGGKIYIEEIKLEHLGVKFDFKEESDGTKRFFDFLPLLLGDKNIKNKTFFIDEIGRSMHPLLTKYVLERVLNNKRKDQLISTTHQISLLDLDILRRDEIWFIEKNKKGASNLYSLEEFKTRKDKDIEKGYIHGRYGAIPVL